MITLRRAISLPLFACAVLLAFAACSSDEAETDSSAAQGDIEAISARIERNEIMFTLVEMGTVLLHDMDEAISAGTIESDFIPSTRKALRLLALTDWGSLQAEADGLAASADALLTALRDNNVESAKGPATALHEGWHDFADEAWTAIEKGSPLLANDNDDDHGGTSTPAAGGGNATSPSGTAEADDHSE